MQDYRLGLRVGLKDLPTLRMCIHRQILTELETLYLFLNPFSTMGTDALCCAPWHAASLRLSFADSAFEISHPSKNVSQAALDCIVSS